MDCKYYLTYTVSGREVTLENAAENDDLSLIMSEQGNRRTITLTAKKDIKLSEYKEIGHPFLSGTDRDGLYFMNGYQSWTDTKETYLCEKEHNINRVPRFLKNAFAFESYGDYGFYDYKRASLHGYDIFYIKGKKGAFIANLNKGAYLLTEVCRKTGKITLISDICGKTLSKGESFTVCDYLFFADCKAGIAELKKHCRARDVQKIFGYTSWYNYYQDINEEILLRDLGGLDTRFNLFQIDDGYETFVGDWLQIDKTKFPNGLSPLVEKVHKKGLMAGIWLAPFVAEEKSRLFSEHKDWFCKDKDGKYIKCGSNWSGFYALDLEKTEVRGYIKGCLKTYADMGFDFFKLDFLYAAGLPEYKGKTRCEAAQDAYSLLREALGDKLILGCGATIINAAETFDYLRVGPDVSLKFDDVFYMRPMHRERISTKVTLQNTVYRSFMDGLFFGNDPDVFLLRDDNISLSKERRLALITINALFGSVMMTSDNISEYDKEKQEILNRSLDLFKNASVEGFERRGKVITVRYLLGGEQKTIKYHTGKGVLL